MAKCFENFVSQTLGFLASFFAAELREYIKKDRKAVEQACCTCFNNGLLEGTVNKIKAIKRSMFNRAKANVLRAKILYANMKWDWNYHPN